MRIIDKWLFNPIVFLDPEDYVRYIGQRCRDKHSLRRVQRTKGHLMLKCPLVGDILDVVGTDEDLTWLDDRLKDDGWYRIS